MDKPWKQRAQAASFKSGIPKIHHSVDGGRVRSWYGSDWKCDVCHRSWDRKFITNITDDEAAARFYLDGDIDSDTYSLVTVVDPSTKKRYTSLVPSREAHKHEQFKF